MTSRNLKIITAMLLVIAGQRIAVAQTSHWIDFNPDNGRSDVRSPHALNWPINTCKKTEQSLGQIRVQLNASDSESSELTHGWWKAGYDSGATFCSDGVTTVANGDSIELTISGLKEGSHSIATWHNNLEEVDQSALDETIDVEMQTSQTKLVTSVNPTQRVTHDDDAQSLYFEFVVRENEPVVVRFKPRSNQSRVMLNGLAIDVADPAWQVARSSPANDDEHSPDNPTLAWQTPRAASNSAELIKYHVYFGSELERVRDADVKAVEFKGETEATSFTVSAADCLADYYWRIDVRRPDGSFTRGLTKRFKTRQLAFPSAEGYGRFAIGGRGGRVIEVTNLQDAGPGSLRAAVEELGPRTVVFRVSGTIQLKSKLVIRNPHITIAGQTAPGDGVCVRGYTFGCMGTHDVIMRYLRIRVGDEAGETMDGTGFASTDHSIFDHCSISWSIDEAVSSRSAKNITLQRSIIAEALNIANHRKYQAGKGHSFAGSISGDIGSFHHNLLAHCAGRNWSLAGGLDRGGHFAGRLDIRNNVVYNWEHRTNDGGAKAVNFVNNLYLPGPATRVFHLLKPDAGSEADRQQYFVAGNRMEGRFDESGDNWRDAVNAPPETLADIRLTAPFCEPHVNTHSVAELLENVLADVGANHAGHDAVDRRVLHDVVNRTTSSKGSRSGLPGIIDSQLDVGGWPTLNSGSVPLDSDHDGMPDDWERAHGLDPDSPDLRTRLNGQRVTALEFYLAELVEKK